MCLIINYNFWLVLVIYGQAYDYVFNVVFEFEDVLLQRHARDMSPSQLQLLHELVT